MTSFQQLEKFLWYLFEKKGLGERHRKRLEWEIKEVDVQGKSDYFLDLYKKKARLQNQNNVIIPFILGICDDFDIDRDPSFVQGDMPDIDVDYLSEVRDHLKNKWAVETFGQDYVCNIGNYTTYGMKSALIDMVRVHGQPREEMMELTKSLDSKDDEGNRMTWDRAMEMYPKLKEYCEKHPEIASAARKLINRNRGMGQHAGGLIISSIPLHDLVPLVKRKDNPQASAWVEGLNGQDLQPVGLVKFDLLVISNLQQISRCCELIKKRHGIKSICALPGQPDWSDINAWRNDPTALQMANEADLKCIFQFDSEGIRRLVRAGGVDKFEDLVAYTALYRPGPLGMLMHERYTQRKRGLEPYNLHPVIHSILGDTYGVMCYQEQIMKILNVVGEIPLRDCEIVRKAISKKKVESFKKYKQMFIQNGMRNLSLSEDEVSNIWDAVQSFSEYGFNKTMTEDTIVDCVDGKKKIKDIKSGDKVYCVNEDGEQAQTEVVAIHDHGLIDVFEVTFDDGYSLKCTLDHKFLTENGQLPLWKIIKNNLNVLSSPLGEKSAEKKRLGSSLWENNPQQNKALCASQGLFEMQEGIFAEKNREIQSQGTLRDKISDNARSCRPLEEMQEMFLSQVEKTGEKTHIKMRFGISSFGKFGGTSSFLREVHENKEEKHSKKNGKIERGQPCSRKKGDIFCHGKENICKKRYTKIKSSSIEEVEGEQSREICKIYRKSSTFPKEIQDGIMVEKSFELETSKNTMWGRQKICRFSQEECLDRSGWAISFLANWDEMEEERSQFENSSEERSNAQRRVFEKEESDLDKNKYDMLLSKDWSHEIGMVEHTPVYAPISEIGNLVHRRVLRVVPMGKRQCYDLEVSCSTHNFILPNGIVTSNSHAVAYTYISSRLLYLKSHYPQEFYSAVLSCETLSEKIKEYKIEAKRHGVIMERADINRSKETFDLIGDVIYFGLSNIKGIGEGPAKRIVAGQPYAGIEDFLDRFGTDAGVLKCLISLRCFKESDPITLWKFYTHYKESIKRIEDRKKRFAAGMQSYDEEFQRLVPDSKVKLSDLVGDDPFSGLEWQHFDVNEQIDVERVVESTSGERSVEVEYVPIEDTEDFVEVQHVRFRKTVVIKRAFNRLKELKKLWNRRKKALERNDQTESMLLPRLADFDPSKHEIEKSLAKELRSESGCEKKMYGFAWMHNLEKSPDFKGYTFQMLRENEGCIVPVEIEVTSVKNCKSQRGNSYIQVIGDDAMGESNRINVFQDDAERWKSELKAGNLLRLRLAAPTGGFSTYTLEKNSKMPNRGWALKYPTKDSDYRVFVMSSGEKEDAYQTDEEVLSQFDGLGAKK